MVCLHQYTEYCAALDTHKRPCGAKTRAGLPWCPRHNEERINICMNMRKVRACTSIERLRRWNRTLVYKYRLITRCIEARAYFTERFFGNDMALLRQQFDVERILAQVEQRAYELILASQNALWVLKQPNDPSQSTLDCDGFDDDSSSDTDCSAKTTSSDSFGQENFDTCDGDVEDPLEVALREKAAALREKISMRLARYCAPADSKFYGERLEVINALVRRAVYTDPSLMVVSQNYDSVLSFIRDPNLPVAILSKLWTSLKELFTDEATGAVDDVLRPKDSNADYVEVLGGRVYKSRSGLEWPFHAWGHFTSIIRCYSCLRKICVSVDDIMALTRFVILTRIPLHQSSLKCYHAWKSQAS
ncbi:hypothetical protein BDZ89DRAFT_442643 [Hymenopellis radicata]|nr:hypothetical protein BDZ89DRAFT_442643 [Hymenopellis radicata]